MSTYKDVKRGYVPTDEKEFNSVSCEQLYEAGADLYYLLNRGYKIKGASVFVGNHFMLSERQRLALVRGVSPKEQLAIRKEKEITGSIENSIVNIDGFNTIITLEVALSDSLLIKCMDGTIRDLAALRGTYRVIEKTQLAIQYLGEVLEKEKIKKAVFYLDAPVSNSGRLKTKIMEVLQSFSFEVEVQVIPNVDSVLEKLENVITSDAIILDRCKSFINVNEKIIRENLKKEPTMNFQDRYKPDELK